MANAQLNPPELRLPVIDLRDFGGTVATRSAFIHDLRQAARDPGFFYLIGHGIDPTLLQRVLAVSKDFFALPEPDKLRVEMANSPHFRGYTRLAWELTRGQPDWREQIDIGLEQARFPLDAGTPAWRRLQGPNQWPQGLPALRPIVQQWQTAALQVTSRLLSAIALSLGQSADIFEPLYRDEPHLLIKLIRYPGREAAQGTQGVGAHKDSGILSLLLQDSQGGLQVQTNQGWVDVSPLEGALVINLGEVLELASDGYLRATLHRVVSPPAGRERLSAAFFLGPRLDATVPHLRLPADLAAQARGVERDPDNPLFRDVGQNYLKGRLRSHPDVARRHYADLVDANAAPQSPSSY